MDALAWGRGLRYNERHKKRSDRSMNRRHRVPWLMNRPTL
jgi:hypothetical protein